MSALGHLRLVCIKCTREARFHADTPSAAARKAVAAGWVMPADGAFVCPKCPAPRVRKAGAFSVISEPTTVAMTGEQTCPTIPPS